MVLKRGVEGSVSRVVDAKVAVFAQGVDTSSTETKVGRRMNDE
jgi:T-complex protein 1 subunit theta